MARGGRLALKNAYVAIATLSVAVVEWILPKRESVLNDFGKATLDLITSAMEKTMEPWMVVPLLAILTLKHVISCLFTSNSFRLRDGIATSYTRLVRYFFLSLLAQCCLFGLFLLAGVMFLALCKIALFPISSILEKALILLVGTLAFPIFAMLYSLVDYIGCLSNSIDELFRKSIAAMVRLGFRGYMFFALVYLPRLLGAAAALIILLTTLTYPLKILAAAILVTSTTMLVRGMRFEFQHDELTSSLSVRSMFQKP